jgi:hypothetical protein
LASTFAESSWLTKKNRLSLPLNAKCLRGLGEFQKELQFTHDQTSKEKNETTFSNAIGCSTMTADGKRTKSLRAAAKRRAANARPDSQAPDWRRFDLVADAAGDGRCGAD